MKLSEHFTLEEFVYSDTAKRKGINNTPPVAVQSNLTRLAVALEAVRKAVGASITISSGYRCPDLNKAVGGAVNSAHLTGLAADITAKGLTPRQLAEAIIKAGVKFDQLIYEGTWIHFGLAPGVGRQQVLTAIFNSSGKASYSLGM